MTDCELEAHYEEEHSVYGEVSVTVRTATSVDGYLISNGDDSTGIMLWPASHLLCYFLASPAFPKTSSLLEMGCGIGKVGKVAALAQVSPVVVCTDCDERALQLADCNLRDQLIPEACTIGTRRLRWGDEAAADAITEEFLSGECFETIVAADIVYPATTAHVLALLFGSVRRLLRAGGSFFCSFVERDWRTPMVLVDAAEKARFSIDIVPDTAFIQDQDQEQLPPMMGARMLHFKALGTDDVAEVIGLDACPVFPGLRARYAASLEASLEEPEEWTMPNPD